MKKRAIVISVILVFLVLFACTQVLAGEYVSATVLNATISSTTPAATVNVAGYKDFQLLSRFSGTPGAKVYLEMYFNGLSIYSETFTIPASGWLNFTKTYTVCAPSVYFCFYNPTAPVTINMTCYAGH